MSRYDGLSKQMLTVFAAAAKDRFDRIIVPFLLDCWVDDYSRSDEKRQLVVVDSSQFSYLFDLEAQRLVSAWGVSAGRHDGKRDKSRMAQAPLSVGPLYHRGHAIPHTLGGPTDINLVPQLARINIGAFRPLERQAVATPGSLYFTYWMYPSTTGAHPSQTPNAVDQGLLTVGHVPDIVMHGN